MQAGVLFACRRGPWMPGGAKLGQLDQPCPNDEMEGGSGGAPGHLHSKVDVHCYQSNLGSERPQTEPEHCKTRLFVCGAIRSTTVMSMSKDDSVVNLMAR